MEEADLERDPNTIDWIDETESSLKKHLSPPKHPQQDFFIADLFDSVSFQDDIASMEHPLFALKAGDKKERVYKYSNASIVVAPNAKYGMATIYDKDIWIYCISKLMQAIAEEKEISRTVRFTVYDYLVTTNRSTGGSQYEQAKSSLDRLRSTTITTDIETDGYREARGFGLIDSWKIVEEKDGRMVRVEATLPEWLYRSVTSKKVLTISPDYFRLRKPIDRRIYELVRKHCGYQSEWRISLDLLHKKTGSTSNLRLFRQAVRSLVITGELPDYFASFDDKKDQVMFTRRSSLKAIAEEIGQEEKKEKRKTISQREAEQMAKVGEEWTELLKRIGSEYRVIFDK